MIAGSVNLDFFGCSVDELAILGETYSDGVLRRAYPNGLEAEVFLRSSPLQPVGWRSELQLVATRVQVVH